MEINIRKAQAGDEKLLTQISFESKRYWNYPEEYYSIWSNELTITADYIKDNLVYLAETEKEIIGYFSIVLVKNDFLSGKVFVKQGYWLEHIFIKPQYIKQGIGRKLMDTVKEISLQNGIRTLNIFSDPNAAGFYDKIGARYKGESLSSIEGRTVATYEWEINNLWVNHKGFLFTDTQEFKEQDLKKLFSSVGWLSANYSERLVIAMKNSSTVISVWDNNKLIGLMNALDDGELTAYIHYLLVDPEYQGYGIGKELVEAMKEKYKQYLYFILISEEKKTISFYQKCGLKVVENTTVMEIVNV